MRLCKRANPTERGPIGPLPSRRGDAYGHGVRWICPRRSWPCRVGFVLDGENTSSAMHTKSWYSTAEPQREPEPARGSEDDAATWYERRLCATGKCVDYSPPEVGRRYESSNPRNSHHVSGISKLPGRLICRHAEKRAVRVRWGVSFLWGIFMFLPD